VLKKILLAAAAAIAILVAAIATRPADFEVERSAVVAAPPAVAYAQVADFGRWAPWSPWAKLDPAMETTLGGTAGAPGHSYQWAGNKEVGKGKMTIAAAKPAERIEIDLHFLEPWEAQNLTTFTFAPDGAGTRVTWSMSGHSNFAMKAMTLFMDMDKMVGRDFEKGLAALQGMAVAEAAKAK
jgi:uncharacterized protein YndB with AHSA1/START domain